MRLTEQDIIAREGGFSDIDKVVDKTRLEGAKMPQLTPEVFEEVLAIAEEASLLPPHGTPARPLWNEVKDTTCWSCDRRVPLHASGHMATHCPHEGALRRCQGSVTTGPHEGAVRLRRGRSTLWFWRGKWRLW